MIERLLHPKFRIGVALVLFMICVVAWPVCALTVFRNEPQGILGLSFIALMFTAYDIIATEIAGMKAGRDDR